MGNISNSTIWKNIGVIAAFATIMLVLVQLSDRYLDRTEKMMKGLVTEAIVKVSSELRISERKISNFLIDDIQFRLIRTRDEIALLEETHKNVPMYLIRQEALLVDQLSEARETWKR